jgi:hypothetical protein
VPECSDRAIGGDHPHPVVAGVRNEHAVAETYRDTSRRVQQRPRRRSAIAAVTTLADACDRRDDAVSPDAPDPVVGLGERW